MAIKISLTTRLNISTMTKPNVDKNLKDLYSQFNTA